MEHNEERDREGCESEKPDQDRRRFHEDRFGETEPARDPVAGVTTIPGTSMARTRLP
jgi:hypothetical protein